MVFTHASIPQLNWFYCWSNWSRSCEKAYLNCNWLKERVGNSWYQDIAACGHMDERWLQSQWPPPAVMKTFEFSCTFMFNWSGNYSLNMGYIVMSFQHVVSYCCTNNISLKRRWQYFAHMWWYRHVFWWLSVKEIVCFYHVTKGFQGGVLTLDWPNYSSMTAWHIYVF